MGHYFSGQVRNGDVQQKQIVLLAVMPFAG